MSCYRASVLIIFHQHILFLTDIYRGSAFSMLLKATLELRFTAQQLFWLIEINFFISPDKQLLSLDPHIWADASPSCAVVDTRNPREMDYSKNKNLYYCCKSNQKEHRAAYQMALISPGMQGKYTSRCIPSILLPALLWLDFQQPDSSTCPVAQLCLAPCCENSVLWIALVLSDTCALSDSYLLPTVCYHSSSWNSSPGKTKQQLHSIRMMLVGEGVCVFMFTPRTSLSPCLLPLGLAVLKITSPLCSFHEEIFAQCMLRGTCCHGPVKIVSLFFEGVLMVLQKSSMRVCFRRLLLLAF